MYINNQQIYNSNGLYEHESDISNVLEGAIYEYKVILHYEVYGYEEFPDEIMEALLSEPFFTRRMKMLSRPDGFTLYVKLGVDFFSTSELLCPNMEIRLRLIRARFNFYMISDNPNVSLGIVACSLYASYSSQGWLSQETNRHACLHSSEIQIIGDSSKDFHHSCQTKPVHSRKHFQQCSISSDCYCNEYNFSIYCILY